MKTAVGCNATLQFNHALLVTDRVLGVGVESPVEKLVGIVGLEVSGQNIEPLAVPGNLVPVALDVLQILGEVGKATLKHLVVELRAHRWLEVNVLSPRLIRLGQHKVSRSLYSPQEGAHFVWVLRDESLISNVQDGAETAAAQLGELINAQHLDICLGPALGVEPLLELDHLHVFEADACVNFAADDGFGDVHAAADGGVVGGREAIVRSQLVDLDLAELADVADAFALERAEVGRDSRLFEVDDTSEWLI